ncbi:MAG: flagellar motor switch protein FliG [Candidatus Eisenbacteria bacterium]|nr:flagellar motor switch protein FliG [Candidatus Eisenbacteria bacterium]
MKPQLKTTSISQLTGAQRAAVLMVSLGPEDSARVLKEMPPADIESLTLEIARLGDVPSELRHQIFEQVGKEAMTRENFVEGGLPYAQQVLERALGGDRAREIVNRVQGSVETTGFEMLRNFETAHLVNFIRNEHPQTIALILAHLRVPQAAEVLSMLPPETQPEIVARLATMDHISSDTISEIESVLSQNLVSVESQSASEVGGVQVVADLLKRLDRGVERNILSTLDRENPAVSQQVKNLMFLFEDIGRIDDRGIQRLLKEVDTKELALALKAASEELKNLIFRNMSERAVEILKEERDRMGPVKLKTFEEAQRHVIDAVRALEEQGEIVIAGRGGKQDEVVV